MPGRKLPAPPVRTPRDRIPPEFACAPPGLRPRCVGECFANPATRIPGQLELEWMETCRSLTAYSFHDSTKRGTAPSRPATLPSVAARTCTLPQGVHACLPT